ncbi:hypothetical protein [Chitinimonas lacunae]|uniref:DUF4276 family protein n=1 Tax=Chitinimonas lacunae TaxID=1963018 RepID=A0ABV8MS75_9NEIS
MSDPQIALIAEGPTDYEVINAALKAILPTSFVLTMLQPEMTKPEMGTGWGGVLKWCDAAGQRHAGSLDHDTTLGHFEVVIIHLDVDVAHDHYGACGTEIVSMASDKGWATLPCVQPCPPVTNSCTQLTTVLNSWLSPAQTGNKTVLCLPAQASGTWLAAATLPEGHSLLAGIECNISVEARLSQLSKNLRIKKTVREYRAFAPRITENWSSVTALCSQAQAFEQAMLGAI